MHWKLQIGYRVGICKFSMLSLPIRRNLLTYIVLSSAHLTFTSLRIRMNNLDEAKKHAQIAKHLLETSGTAARFSWLSSYCAYRVGQVAMKQGRLDDAM